MKTLTVLILLMVSCAGIAYAGMTWNSYVGIKARNRATMSDVFEHAGPPDMTRESGHTGNKIYLYYLGGKGGRSAEVPTTVVIDGRTDRVLEIKRNHR